MSGIENAIGERLLSPQFLQDPYPMYAALREDHPVLWFEPWRCWLVSRHEDISSVLRQDGKAYSVAGRVSRSLEVLSSDMQADLEPIRNHFASGLLHSDPPEHTRLRLSVSKALTPRSVAALVPRIESITDVLLGQLDPSIDNDLVTGFAFQLPLQVLAEVLGFPVDRSADAKRWADAVTAFTGTNLMTAEIARRGQAELLEARSFLASLVTERSQCPADDVISRLSAAMLTNDEITESEILNTCMTFLIGGHETTAALITTGLLTLSRFPDQRALLRDDPSLMATAINELLRYESPNQRVKRIAIDDTEVNGTEIQKGDEVMLLLGSGNRDADVFSSPDDLDVARWPNRHLSFATGAHLCIGAPLARLEGEIAIATILQRFPNHEIKEPAPTWAGSPTLRILTRLNSRLRPAN